MKTNCTAEQLDKLPKWAKQEIINLTRQNQSLKEKIDQYSDESETNTYILDGLDKKPLPKNSIVEFKSNDFNKATVRILDDGTIDINTDSRQGKALFIRPRAANAFYIEFH